MRVDPLFSNTLGHCAGVAVFCVLLYLFLTDWKRSKRLRSGLSTIAAALGLIWNVCALSALDPGFPRGAAFHALHAFAFSALSFFPAVLLHIRLQRRTRYLWMGGYLLSLAAVILQIRAELTRPLAAFRYPSLFIVIGFSGLTIICLCQSLRPPRLRPAEGRLAAAMLLLLPAIFLISGDISHAGYFHFGLPPALFVLLYDFRFLILDALSRFFLRVILAAGGAALSFAAVPGFHFTTQDPFKAALALAAVVGGLLAILRLSQFVERLTAWFLRHRSRPHAIPAMLRDHPIAEYSDDEYLDHARCIIETFFQCRHSEFRDLRQFTEPEDCSGPAALPERSQWPIANADSWAETSLTLHFSNGDGRVLLLGPRRGQRPYRHEDFLSLSRFGRIIEQHIERRRQFHAHAFASHAELRALQSQINPHFFFNSLNTLYGVISRDNAEARRLVLNLADVSYYLLRSDRTFVSLRQELAIINAYLEIEKLRLGPRLTTSIHIDEELLEASIPVLSIQPLVENAVKHGVASCSGNGFVGLTVRSEEAHLKIEVVNTGKFGSQRSLGGAGVGLDNVQRRLALCYGAEAGLHISSKENLTVVCFSMPLSIQAPSAPPKPKMKNTLSSVSWERPLAS